MRQTIRDLTKDFKKILFPRTSDFIKVLSLFFSLVGCSTVQAQSTSNSYPKVFIEYGSSLDLQICPHGLASSVLLEVQQKLPTLRNLWSSYENPLLGTTTTIVGKSFFRHEETVSVLACPNLKGQAEPLLVPIWPYLSTTTRGSPFDMRFFIGVTFHELLHRYVDNIFGGLTPSTPLLKKYSNESLLVRRHLHVDAIQKAVYLRLGLTDEIKAIIANDSKSFGPDYARAWQIVNDIEGPNAFVQELQ